MKKKIYYVMDTICGWCYGFNDVITKIHEKHKDKFDFEIIPSAMWGDNLAIVADTFFGGYIKNITVSIEELTSVYFGEAYKNVLDNGDRVLDSLPGAKAIVLFQKSNKDMAFDFLQQIQKAFFVNGEDLNDITVYTRIAESFGISKEEFEKKLDRKSVV